ncbi:MAG: S9 family peptidase [Porphyromonadaceae bacterium]|nr:S9 family peptidase [Porphyromonadaceae bacterium]
MNHKQICSLVMAAFLSTSGVAEAQTAPLRTMTLSEYTAGSPQYIHPDQLSALQWFGSDYIFARKGELVAIDLRGGERTLLSLDELRGLLPESEDLKKAKHFPRFSVVSLGKPLLRLKSGKSEYLIDPASKRIERSWAVVDDVQASRVNPQYSHIAEVRAHNLVIRSLRTREADRVLTQDGSEQIVYGQSVHQNEFGITGGLFWSPDGRKLAFYRMDQSMVEPYPILHINARRPYRRDQYYPMAGTTSHQVTLGIYDLSTGQTVYLQTGEPRDKYLTNIAWSPDSKEIYLAELNRAQTQYQLKAFSPNTGKELRTLFTESHEVYAEPLNAAQFVPGKPDQFVWQSRRDGFNHLYLYHTSGKLLGQLTKGAWEVTSFVGFAPDGKSLYYLSTEVSPLDRHLYRVRLSGGTPLLLTPERGFHTARFSPDGKYFLDTYSSTEVAGRSVLRSAVGKELKVVHNAKNPDEGFATPSVELGTIKAADNQTDLHYRLIKPYNFDSKKKYPTIIYVYNGPHAQLVQNRHRAAARGWELNMANLGYIIFTVDGRGSAYRGAAFEQVIHRQLGKNEMADQMRGVDFLKSHAWVDASRIGVYGWSYGGFMTTNLMLTHPETFKVGVAGGPVIDWSRYEIMYGERYMDTPEENPEGYAAANLAQRAGDLKGRLMLIHGTVDPVVIWQHSLLFVEAAVKAGVHPDYMVYPEHEHNVIGPDRVHLNQIITRYFQDHL